VRPIFSAIIARVGLVDQQQLLVAGGLLERRHVVALAVLDRHDLDDLRSV
jgi:hypothetical protein